MPDEKLTDAETRVAELVADEMTNAEIAATLVVSVNTVKTHVAHVFRKTGVHNRRNLRRLLKRNE